MVLFIFGPADFDDMSCEMIFGQDPPASTDDPALKQPCYNLCTKIFFFFKILCTNFIARLFTFNHSFACQFYLLNFGELANCVK